MSLKKRQRREESFQSFIEKINDGGQSRNDWKTRAIITLEPVYKNIYISNLEGIKQLTKVNKNNNYVVLSVQTEECVDDDRVDNSIKIDDSMVVDQEEFDIFMKNAVEKLTEMAKKNEWVVVNCKAGINRSSAVVVGWMMSEYKMSYKKALSILKKKKAEAARFFQFKNRYQSFKQGSTLDKFSWPALYGDSTEKLVKALQFLLKKKVYNQ